MSDQSNPVDIEAIMEGVVKYNAFADSIIDDSGELTKEDGHFISSSLQNIPTLCDEVKALRANVAIIQANNIKMQDVIELHEAHVRILKANEQKVHTLRANVKGLEDKEIQPLKIDIVWGGEKASVTVSTNQIVNACYPAAFMENEIIKLFRLVVPKPFKRENIPVGPTKGD